MGAGEAIVASSNITLVRRWAVNAHSIAAPRESTERVTHSIAPTELAAYHRRVCSVHSDACATVGVMYLCWAKLCTC